MSVSFNGPTSNMLVKAYAKTTSTPNTNTRIAIEHILGAVHKVRHAILANFYPLPLSHFVTHPGTPKVRHTSRTPRFLVGLVRGFCQGVFCLEGLVRGGFCPFPLLSEYICYNRKLTITLNFMSHVYDKKFI